MFPSVAQFDPTRLASEPRTGGRIIDYPAIDAGRTRAEANAEITAANLAQTQHSCHQMQSGAQAV